ncbi:MAG: dockerin type I domain-containing protein [Planctomycetota bacterium]
MVFAAAAGCGFAAPAYADWDQTAKLTADDPAAGDVFGFSVGISGTIAIVGAPQDDDAGSSAGSAYVFDTTTGAQIAKLTAPDAAANDRFGESVGVSGTIAIVGAHEDDDAGSNSGSAYLFDTTTGSQLFKLTANDAAAGDEFGFSVGISGATAIVGAHADGAGFNSGSAYLFDTITGAQIAKLTANDAAVNDWFGESVGISGTTAIVGARFDDDAGFSSGSAYLFDTTTGAQIAKLTASDAAAGEWFGYSVGISGTTAIVGAHADDDAGSASGSAYLFDTTTGAQIAKLTANDAAARDNFGFSVGISGTIAIVGAHADDDAGYSSGSVYLFDTTTGNQIAKLTASDAAAHDRFGWSVGISGTTAVVGAYADDDGGGNSGSAYVYKFVLPGDADGNGSVDLFDFHILAANFGASTGNLGEDGDFNGDGVVDLIDFDTLAQNFGSTSPAVVPAPASLSLLGLASPLLLRGRARRRRS